MTLRDSLDWRSAAYAVIVVGGVMLYGFGPASLVEALAYAPLVAVAAAGVLVPVRERVPEFDRLIAVGLGVVGVYGLTVDGVGLLDVVFVLAGVVAVLSVVYEHVTGRSTRFA